jgi:sulfite reductase (NADPH) flavoprotein alpha-component
MLTSPKLTLVQELIAGASREELIWLSGYLAGVVAQRTHELSAPVPGPAAAAPANGTSANPGTELSLLRSTVPANGLSPAVENSAAVINKITIAYGTETGNSKKLAYEFAAKAKKKGINAKLVGLEQYRLNDLPKEEYFFTVISTQGDGEPPAAAKKFYDHLYDGSLRLDRMKYSVLALGDTAYPLFCKAGEDIDQQLQKSRRPAHRLFAEMRHGL